MADATTQESEIKIGDKVYNRHRQEFKYKGNKKYNGIVVDILPGLRPLYYVDCGNEFINAWCASDTRKCEPGRVYQ